MEKSVAIVGMGNLGQAIKERIEGDFDVVGLGREDDKAIIGAADIAILSVKPRDFDGVVSEIRDYLNDQLIISVMASITVQEMVETLGTNRIVRTMPNLALKTGESTTGWYAEGAELDAEANKILDIWGDTVQIDQEDQFLLYTAIPGSGPALILKTVAGFEKAAKQGKFSEENARKMAAGALRAAASLLQENNSDVYDIINSIASPGGTTEAALMSFEIDDFDGTIQRAVLAAMERGYWLRKPKSV